MNDLTFIEMLWDKFLGFLPTLGIACILLIVGLLIKKAVIGVTRKALERGKFDRTVTGFAVSACDVAITALVVIIVLSTLGIPMTSIIAVFTAAGLAVSLALQNSLSNVAGGFIILTTKPFKSGEYISAAGIEGTVDEISILTTKIITVDNKDIFVPNGTLASAAVTNYTREGKRRVDYVFPVSYKDDYKKAESIILKTVSKLPDIMQDPAPFVKLSSFGANTVSLECRVWTSTDKYWDVYYDIIESVKNAFDENDLTVPYQRVEVMGDKK